VTGQPFLLLRGIRGTRLGLGLGFPEQNLPMGLLIKTRPYPQVGFSWVGWDFGRVLARPCIRGTTSTGGLCSLSVLQVNLEFFVARQGLAPTSRRPQCSSRHQNQCADRGRRTGMYKPRHNSRANHMQVTSCGTVPSPATRYCILYALRGVSKGLYSSKKSLFSNSLTRCSGILVEIASP
jgi:hypothetical protein